MKQKKTVKVVWSDGVGTQSREGQLVSDDDVLFLKMLLIDGTELNVAKTRIVALEKFH